MNEGMNEVTASRHPIVQTLIKNNLVDIRPTLFPGHVFPGAPLPVPAAPGVAAESCAPP